MIRVYLSGRHARRTPLSYPALADLWDGAVTRVDHPDQADLYVFAHVLDIQTAAFDVVEDWRARRRPVVLLSEEPFWDTIWGKHPLDPVIYVDTQFGVVPVHQLNHTTSDIYRFDHIPYYLLTNPRFGASYVDRFTRGAAGGVAAWREVQARAPLDIGFMFERRPEGFHDVAWPKADLIGLCAWRTRLAEACAGDAVRRWGQSWEGGPSRFDIKGDWHADKLARLNGQCRLFGAVENTHHPDYITEKLFDALACGAVPLYFAGPSHRVHALDLPTDAWINLFDRTPEAAADSLDPSQDRSDALHAAHVALAARFGDRGLWHDERLRLRAAVMSAFEALL